MAVEANKLYKLTNGNLANADHILTNKSFILNNMLQFAFDGITTTNQVNLHKELFTSDTAESTVNMKYDSVNDYYKYYQIDDEIDNSDYTEHWTAVTSGTGTNTVTENTTYLELSSNTGQYNLTGHADVISDGGVGTAIDYYNSNQDVYIEFQANIYTAGRYTSNTYGQARFGLSDGTNDVWLYTQYNANNTSTTDDSVWSIYINAAANTCDLYNDGVLDTADIDISSITGGNYYFIMDVDSKTDGGGSTNSTGRIRLYYLYSLGVGYTSGSVITTSLTTEDINSVYLLDVISTINPASDIEINISFNDGNDYSTGSVSVLSPVSVTGSDIKCNLTVSSPTSITSGTSPISSYINGYGFYYG